MVGCENILWYLDSTIEFGIEFRPSSYITISVFYDANWDSYVGTRISTFGLIMYLRANHIIWEAHKRPIVARSSIEAEYRCLASKTAKVSWVHPLLSEVQIVSSKPVIWCNSTSVIALSANPMFHSKIMHIDLDYHLIMKKW